jgi:hypothetical protein
VIPHELSEYSAQVAALLHKEKFQEAAQGVADFCQLDLHIDRDNIKKGAKLVV